MKRVISIFFILSFPTLVFADMLYFKDDTSIEGEIIDYKGDYIIFKVDNINDMHSGNRKYVIKEIDIQTIMFDMNYVYMATDTNGEIVAMRIGQDESIIGTNELQYQEKAMADALEDFNTGLKWSGGSILAFAAGLFFIEKYDYEKILDTEINKGFLIGSTVAFIGPIAASYLLPADDFRLDNLSTKNENHRNAYHSTYEREIRKKRLKYSLIGTSCATTCFGIYAVLNVLAIIGLMGHH